ncbi:hypothetical protein [Rhodospirillum sp. A1_3_36]|uniref:hypothetical protein n=1 Tax=Rhodospirillum sp. A1_3_36 TaxID=3391666 RepID=UPI0039A64331
MTHLFLSRSLCLSTAGLVLSARTSAQTAGQITPDCFAPPVIRSEDGGLTLSAPSSLTAPEGAEDLTVTPSWMVVEGGLPDVAEETAAIAARLNTNTKRRGLKPTPLFLRSKARRALPRHKARRTLGRFQGAPQCLVFVGRLPKSIWG